VGVLVSGCSGVSLGNVDSGALGALVLFPASSPQPAMTMTHAASAAMGRIRSTPFRGFDRKARTAPPAGSVICR
jgi:hypothetical protein